MRRILRVVKATVVLSIVFLMTVDSANACRLLRLLFAHHACCEAPVTCDDPCSGTASISSPMGAPIVAAPIEIAAPVIVSSPVVSDYVSAPLAPSNCCCCGGGVVESAAPIIESAIPSGVVDDGYVEGGYVDGGYPVESYPTDGTVIESYDSGTVIEGEVYQPSPMEVLPADSTMIAPEDGTVITPYDAGGDVTPVPTPEDSLPSTDTPLSEESPLDSAVDPPADAGGDDDPLFPPDDAGAGAGGAVDEGFGADLGGQAEPIDEGAFGDETAPAIDETTPPPAEDNLFESGGDAPADDTSTDLFGGDTAPADDTPADMPTDDFFDDGGDPAPGDAPTDDLFDGGGDDAPLDDGDDLFSGTTNSSETVATSSETVAGDELFEEPTSDPIEDVLPGNESLDAPLDDAPADDDLDDLFGKNSNDGMRVWTDNTGKYKTVGRLVVIARTHVRLLKENGRYSTVPLSRLSNADLDYVMVVAKRLSDEKGLASL